MDTAIDWTGMRPTAPDLYVTLVSGLDPFEAAAVAAILSGRPSALTAQPAVQRTDNDDDFAIELASTVSSMADRGARGHVVVHLDPRVDTMEVGLVLGAVFDGRDDDLPVVRLRDLVSVVDPADVRHLLFGENRATSEVDEDHDSGERLARQIEYATVITVCGAPNARLAALRDVERAIATLNPHALVVPRSAALDIVATPRRRIAPGRLGESMGWMLELSSSAELRVTRDPRGSFVFRDPRPFHPGRLADAIGHCLQPERVGTIIRSRGLVQLASRADRVGSWSSAGRILSIDPTSMTSGDPDSPSGQELVFFGTDLRSDELSTLLAACLLSGDELIAGPMEWANYADPFPAWVVEHDD